MTSKTENVRPIECKIEPKTKVDEVRLLEALQKLASLDPTFGFWVDPESGEIIVAGQSELHLDAKIDHLIQGLGIGVTCGAPKVAYRETLARPTDVDYTHKKRTQGMGQFAHVKLKLVPNGMGKGNVFETLMAGDTLPHEYVLGVEKGVKSVCNNGILIGYPMVDMKVTLGGGAFHETDSSAIAFEIAARQAMKEACTKGGVKLLEPIMKLEVKCPAEFVRPVLTNLDGRRGKILSQEIRELETVIQAEAPCASMFGWSSEIRKLTNGSGTFQMVYDHYDFVPRNIDDGPGNFPPAIGMRA